MIHLRDVLDSDLPIFFEQERDADAVFMAAFTAKDPSDRQAFDAHWAKIRADDGIVIQTILVNGEVAGSVLVYPGDLGPEVSYWLGKEYWGKGIATRALSLFLKSVTARPLYARVVDDNHASRRVLEKCGFKFLAASRGFANARGKDVDESTLILEANPPEDAA
ncbi:MAG: GNAT family N-acetyltransferase [Anaerolineaceae bacterium]